ncbi:MAG: branched-chain amino acid ABC transporter permease [Archaeoglobaceae archaeon]|nr:branched-chain amino acid ABC transporter permease [Archaeoglobaceae archaeon]MDW8117955.1 branched-chain amino acid ABC transporter permease [Archaeoglobaceae archaeon]
MVKIEARRGRIVIHAFGRKYEWTVEPRYWRNPIIGLTIWLSAPIVLYITATTIFNYQPVALMSTLIFANLLIMMAVPFNLQVIGTGRLSFGPHFFLAVGGYTAALLSRDYGLSPALTLPAAFGIGALIALAISPITIISRGVYYVLITLLLPFILGEITYWRSDIFGAETGIPNVGLLFPSTGNVTLDVVIFVYVSLAIALIFLFFVDRTLRSRYGFMMGVINEDEDVALSYGINVRQIKILTFTFTSGAMAICGWFLAHYQGSFSGPVWLMPSFLIMVLLTATLGGKGAIYGVVISAYIVATLREVTRVTFGELSVVVLFLILLLLLYFLREGFWGLYRKRRYREYEPSIKVRKKT